MINRIKELAIQSGLLFKLGSTIEIDENSTHTIEELKVYDNFDHEKFAELIVNECIAIAASEFRKDIVRDGSDYDEGYANGRMMGAGIVRDKIKEYFGAEE